MRRPFAVLILLFYSFASSASFSGEMKPVKEPREFLPAPFDRYFERRVKELSEAPWQKEITPENWPEKQADMRKKLQRMLGLDPYPERTPLIATVTGTVNGDGFVVEKMHFQSMPGLYVAANLYRPKDVPQPLPTILYVCGHAKMVEGSVIYGNKTGYEHHGAWFARHGYVCLALDTIQLGEIKGEHAGTYSLGRWWWPARGYTPGGVETWSGIRALDYLLTRPEVDGARIGMTGRSGGGAYSWYVAALDDRVKVVAPTAGVATLKNHVLDGAIEGHCDCMFYVNTERWNFDRLTALIAPRPLLISNSDKDDIFPLDGVHDIYQRTRALYRTLNKEGNIGFHVAEGPHKDTQQLNIGAFNWLNRFLKGGDRADFIDEPARKMLQPRELKVFAEIPKDERVTTADEYFVPAANMKIEALNKESWPRQRDEWMRALRSESFRAWPNETNAKASVKSESSADGVKLTVCEFLSEEPFTLNIWLLCPEALKTEQLESLKQIALNEDDWRRSARGWPPGFPRNFLT